ERMPAQPAAPAPRTGGGPAALPAAVGGGRTWARLLPVLALAAALPFWPYERACGSGLLFYLASVGVLTIAAVWCAAVAWKHRRALAHVAALLALLWGLVLASAEVLPRVGYAARAAAWLCR
ncbi:MAG TPA: hypothetical protein VFU46_14210, partial [Gemmatimonadales bacterium]|nr:hypothetical protein [Gemmatimonadales bacterium]